MKTCDTQAADQTAVKKSPEPPKYICNACRWTGDKPFYANEDGAGHRLYNGHISAPNSRVYAPLQAHCPQCGNPFK